MTSPGPTSQPTAFPSVTKLLAVQFPPGSLFHYTDQSGFLGILKSNQLWATGIQFLNDSREYVVGLQMLTQELAERSGSDAELKTAIGAHLDISQWGPPLVGVVSLSERRDDLSQWRAYAGGAGGFALGFEGRSLMRAINPRGAILLPVQYVDPDDPSATTQIVKDFCDDFARAIPQVRDPASRLHFQNMAQLSAQVVCSVREDRAFADEKEWRVVVPPTATQASLRVRSGRSMPTPYWELDVSQVLGGVKRVGLSEIIVGPTPHPELAARGARMVALLNGEVGPITASRVPYRGW